MPWAAFALDGVEYFDGVGYLKGGLVAASAITTVSPTYAAEIRTPAEGMALDGLLRGRTADLHGIVNGIDADVWDPASDPTLAGHFSAQDPPAAPSTAPRSRRPSGWSPAPARSSAPSPG